MNYHKYHKREKSGLEALDNLLNLDDYTSEDRKAYMKELGEIIENDIKKKDDFICLLIRFDLKPSFIVEYETYEDFMLHGYLSYGETIEQFFARDKKAPTREEFELLRNMLA